MSIWPKRRAIVCGMGPSLKQTPSPIWGSGKVIAVDRAWNHVPNWDFWIGWNTAEILTNELVPPINEYVGRLFIKQDDTYTGDYPSRCLRLFDTNRFPDTPPADVDKVYSKGHSIIAACSWAWGMGAEEILLSGVEYRGVQRVDGQVVDTSTWAAEVALLNKFFEKTLPIPVYKMVPDGPLEIPYKEYNELLLYATH